MTEIDVCTRERVAAHYRSVRSRSAAVCAPLATEDHVVQSMDDVSPPKWHLAHTTWFFETFVLEEFDDAYRCFHPRFRFLFNSYYETVGAMHARARRGLLSRPTLAEVHAYRAHVDARVERLLASCRDDQWRSIAHRVRLGLAHEEQHQELTLMDVKHILGTNPLRPAYFATGPRRPYGAPELEWLAHEGGDRTVGAATDGGFDNEYPRHRVLLHPFELASRCVTNGEFARFVADGGYERVDLWLSDGWAWLQEHAIDRPLYWEAGEDGVWQEYTFAGLLPLDDDAPVAHVSFFEAEAYARWVGARLPTEFEWEVVAADVVDDPVVGLAAGHWYDGDALHPLPAVHAQGRASQLFGDVWEWTSSAYRPYPGFKPLDGALGEYNGKFMNNQFVSRGGSCLTPEGHARVSYRNFFYPHQRWAMQGFRLARDHE